MEHLFEVLNFQFDSTLTGWPLWTVLGTLGLAVGIITGLFGVGGGFLVTPMLVILTGVAYPTAVASDLCFIIGTSASGLSRHRRLGNVDLRVIFMLASGSIIGAVLGHLLQTYLNGTVAPAILPDGSLIQQGIVFKEMMHGFFVVILLLTAWLVWRGAAKREDGLSPIQKIPVPPFVNLKSAGLSHVSLPGLVCIGMSVGVLTGLLGVGGGVLFMPVLILVVGLDPHKAVGTSLGVVLLSAVSAIVIKGWAGQVSIAIAGTLMLTSVIGVQIGVWICMKLHAEKLRKFFAVIVLLAVVVVGIDMIRQYRKFHSHSPQPQKSEQTIQPQPPAE